ncbi:MAG: hypothetical protein JW969_08580 [Spirochaetales bacterium]|nr:hypothetical protein [Spirochaetales bacterium]
MDDMNIKVKLNKVTENTAAVADYRFINNAGAFIMDSYIVAADATMIPQVAAAFRRELE